MEANIPGKQKNNFTFCEKTEEMIISSIDKNTSISLKQILLATSKCNEIGAFKSDYLSNYYLENLEITYIDHNSISFKIFGNIGDHILRNPLVVEISGKQIEIVCSAQLNYFLKKSFLNPTILCSCGKKSEVTIRNLNAHINHEYCIIDLEDIKPLEEIQLSLIIINHRKDYLKETFKSPQEFETNFNYYFKFRENKKELNGFFNIFDDLNSTRFYISYEFIDIESFGQKLTYFGASGKGKSITLIGALKYYVDHKEIGTLYINCKTLKVLFEKQQITTLKRIIVDEILYLFYENYDNYLSCFQKIKSFNFLSSTSFWTLIELILEECTNINKSFIVGFDQYNNSIDPNNNLNDLEDKYLKNNKKFKFIVISSMNETDVRQQKLNLLFGENITEKVFELDYICDNFQTNFNKEELNVFKKLGKTFKVYNEINLIENKSEINSYLEEKKKKYLYKIISFYKNESKKGKYNSQLSEEEIMDISNDFYVKFLLFKINYKYSKSEIMKIVDYIPFRIFNITQKNGRYTVISSFPLINEILDDIYRYIILKRDFNAFKLLNNNRGSAFSTLFEYKVRYNFYPIIKGVIHYFKNFDIEECVTMEVFIPKEKSKKEAKFIQKLEKGKSYLVEQKQFGGKDLDFLIIHMSENPEIFGFQVSTYKPKPKIFTSLDKTYKILIERLNSSFELIINENNAYFGYIFDFSRINDHEYGPMLTNCNKKKIKYSFFDTETNTIYNEKYKQSNDIYDIVGKVKMEKIINQIKSNHDIDIENFNPITKLNSGQISTIINILRVEKNDNNISSLYFNYHQSNIPFDENCVCIDNNSKDNLLIFFFADKFLMSRIISANKNIEINNTYFSDNYDVYKIIRNENI